MFERFTERARQVVDLAQDESRLLKHDYVGTEHLLLGLLREEEGIAARVLESFEVTLDEVRAKVVRGVGRGEEAPAGQIPFTPRAKRVLELSLREALRLGHNYIGTEHILLGLVRQKDGAGARILAAAGAGGPEVAAAVVQLLGGRPERAKKDFAYDDDSALKFSTFQYESSKDFLAFGWILFVAAFSMGLFLGWLIWG